MTTDALNPNARIYLVRVFIPDHGFSERFLIYSEPGDIFDHVRRCCESVDWLSEVAPDLNPYDLDYLDERIAEGDIIESSEVTEPTDFVRGYGIPWGEYNAGGHDALDLFHRIEALKAEQAAEERRRLREAENDKRQVSIMDALRRQS